MPSSSGRALEILSVDDDPADAMFLTEGFKASEHRVRLLTASSVDQGLGILTDPGRVRLPDLVLLDLRMPMRDGFEFLAAVRESPPPLRYLPIIVLSTSAAPDDFLKAYRLGANCYIQKPRDFEGYLRITHCIGVFWLNVVALQEP